MSQQPKKLTPQEFYRATTPNKTLDMAKLPDKHYHIDFSSVRGEEIIENLKTEITWSEDKQFTCNLFTGHVGCGKSTELLRLKSELEEEGYHAIYFEATDDLDIGNVEVSDILLAIARRTAQEFEKLIQKQENSWQGVMDNAKKLLFTEIKLDVKSGEIPGVGKFEFGVDFDNNVTVGLSSILGSLKTQTRKNTDLKYRLKQYLEPKTAGLIDVLNKGLFKPIHATLQEEGKVGLVVLMDNLDKLMNVEKSPGKNQSAYLFADRGDDLSRLACHLIYTMPLGLRYSDDYPLIAERFKTIPVVLPMIPVQNRQGEANEAGIQQLYQMVLARAFPTLSESERLDKLSEIFDKEETLREVCTMSGGHVRNLLIMLNKWIIKQKKFPLSIEKLKEVVVNQVTERTAQITPDEWDLLNRVHKTKELAGDEDFSKLIRTLCVYEYRDEQGAWYEVNPILLRTGKIKR